MAFDFTSDAAAPLGQFRSKTAPYPIAFFDGDCLMCNAFVDVLIKLDRHQRIRLAPLQGETARQQLPPLPDNPERWSIFYQDPTGTYSQSGAVLRICGAMGLPWSALRVFRLVPRSLRDGLYRWVARNRYRWFGKRDTCRMPTAADRDRFLP
jgi:predicted DCC family thiol-disulfide oxidoreductase YuxK